MKKFLITLFSALFITASVHAEDINIAFTIDNNYPIFTLLAINSILQNNKSDSHYNFYIVENNLTDKNKKRMEKYVKERNQNIEFLNIDTNVIDDGDYFFGFSGRITQIAMARIMLADLLPKNIHKIIYLDGDICVTEDMKNLFDIDLGNYPAGLARNISEFESVELFKLKDGYYNSGVIIMNLDMWRRENISKKMVDFVKNNKDKFVYKGMDYNVFLYPDQDLINVILNGRIKEIPQRWNDQTIRGEILEYLYGGGIVHYIGDIKPWDYPINPDDGFKLYYKYWNTSNLKRYKYYYAFSSLKSRYISTYDYKINRFLKFRRWFLKAFEV